MATEKIVGYERLCELTKILQFNWTVIDFWTGERKFKVHVKYSKKLPTRTTTVSPF